MTCWLVTLTSGRVVTFLYWAEVVAFVKRQLTPVVVMECVR